MVIEDFKSPQSDILKAQGERPESRHQAMFSARTFDRFAAFSIDYFLILFPLIHLLVSPFRKELLESYLVGLREQSIYDYSAIVLIGLLSVVAYQTIMIYFFGATFGQRAFKLKVVDIWTGQKSSFGKILLRAFFSVGEACLLGIPWLSVFNDYKRRLPHDRISDSIVISSSGSSAEAPAPWQQSFVNGVFLAILLVSLFILSSFWSYFYSRIKEQQNLSSSDGVENEIRGCDSVDSNLILSQGPESRITSAMELFAAGLIDAKCLKLEAKWVLNGQKTQSPLAYMALAFVEKEERSSSEDSIGVSNQAQAYVNQGCLIAPTSEACSLKDLIQVWPIENSWEPAGLFLHNIPPTASRFLLIWKTRYLINEGFFEQGLSLINKIGGASFLSGFLIPNRVKALWGSQRVEEARWVASTAFETLPEEERFDLSGWMCFQELSLICQSASLPKSCEHFVKSVDHSGANKMSSSGWLSLLLIKEKCSGSLPADEYAQMMEASSQEDVSALFESLYLKIQNKKQDSQGKLEEIAMDNQKFKDEVRIEALTRLVKGYDSPKELENFYKRWGRLQASERRRLGPYFFKVLKEKGEMSLALKVGWKILDENRFDLNINRDLVVTAYQLGRKKDAWALLKSYRQRYDLLHPSRTPAAQDEFLSVTKILNREFGEM